GYLSNTLLNLPAVARGHDVRALTGAYTKVPAIVAGAGPSLDRLLPDIGWARNRALLIACDTAPRPLLGAGLAPQLVVAVDPGAANARHFLELPDCSHSWLVTEGAVAPAATELFGDRTFWFRVADHHPWPWLNGLGIDIGVLPVWGSVLTAAF